MLVPRDFMDILQFLKEELNSPRKIFDKDIAKEMNVKEGTFNTWKHRGVIPYKKINEFCINHNIDLNKVYYI